MSLQRLTQAREWIRRQSLKDELLDPAIFAGPAWTIFLAIYTAELEGRRMSVAELCAGTPGSTVTTLRWIDVMIKGDFIYRLDASVDMRCAGLGATEKGRAIMDRLLDESAV